MLPVLPRSPAARPLPLGARSMARKALSRSRRKCSHPLDARSGNPRRRTVTGGRRGERHGIHRATVVPRSGAPPVRARHEAGPAGPGTRARVKSPACGERGAARGVPPAGPTGVFLPGQGLASQEEVTKSSRQWWPPTLLQEFSSLSSSFQSLFRVRITIGDQYSCLSMGKIGRSI